MTEVTCAAAPLCPPSVHLPNARRFMTIVEKGKGMQQQQNEILGGTLSYIPLNFPFFDRKNIGVNTSKIEKISPLFSFLLLA